MSACALITAEARQSALLAGASEVLTHPYRKADIRDVINRYLPDLDDRRVRMAQLAVGEVELNG